LKRLQAELAKQLEDGDLETGFGSLPVGWDECYLGEEFDLRACYLTAAQRERLAGGAAGSLWFVSGVAYAAKGLGLLLTALAASLGAPFWFGLLQQLNAIRRTGPKPVSSTSG
jgi:hypothetical protein